MNIHIVTHQDMDGFLWGVLEGWANTGVLQEHTVRVCGDRTLLPQAIDFWETLPTTDAILLCITSAKPTFLKKALKIIEHYNLWNKVIHSDYVHNQDLVIAGVAKKSRKVIIGKRYKWLKVKDWPNTEWLPRTGIQQATLRYHPALPWEMWKDIPVFCTYHTFKRGQKHRLKWIQTVQKHFPNGHFGCKPDDRITAPILRKVYGSRHTPTYLEMPSRSRIGVYLMGGNALGHQFWEFAALECAIVAMHHSLHPTPEEDTQEWEHFENPLVEGEDFLYFRNADDLVTNIQFLVDHPDQAQQMARNAFLKTRPFWSDSRSKYILDIIQGIGSTENG